MLPTLSVLAVLLMLAVPMLTRWLVRRWRWRDATSAGAQARVAWTELQDTLIDHGYDWDPSWTPRRGGAQLMADRHLTGAPAAAIHRLTRAVEHLRYAPAGGVDGVSSGDLRGDVELVRTALAKQASRRERARALVLPRSTRAVAAAISERVADGLDGLDQVGSRLTRMRVRRS